MKISNISQLFFQEYPAYAGFKTKLTEDESESSSSPLTSTSSATEATWIVTSGRSDHLHILRDAAEGNENQLLMQKMILLAVLVFVGILIIRLFLKCLYRCCCSEGCTVQCKYDPGRLGSDLKKLSAIL